MDQLDARVAQLDARADQLDARADQLGGSLHCLGLPRLLGLLADARASGYLRIWDEHGTGVLALVDGRVVGASFGVDRGRAALAAIAFALPAGRFALVSTPPDQAPELNASRQDDRVILSEARPKEPLLVASVGATDPSQAQDDTDPLAEVKGLARVVPGPSAVPRVVAGGRAMSVQGQVLDYGAVATLMQVDGQRTVAALAADRGLLRTVRELAALVRVGLVEFVDRAPVDTNQPAAVHVVPPSGVFAGLGALAYDHRWRVAAAGLGFVLASAAFGFGVFGTLKAGGFVDPRSESTRAAELLQHEVGRDQGNLVVMFSSLDGRGVDEPAYREAVEAILSHLAGQPGVGTVSTYYDTGLEQLASADRSSTYAVVGLDGDDDAQVKATRRLRPLLTDSGGGLLDVRLGGRPAVYEELVDQTEHDLRKAELIAFPVVAVLLVLIFGSMVAAALPLAVGATSIAGAFLVLRLVGSVTDISLFAINIITLLGFGLAIDYSLFVVSRFREELEVQAGSVRTALVRTLQTAGHTVLFSGLTVIISLLSLMLFAPMFVRTMGFGAAVAVGIAVVAALTVLPATLGILGTRVNALSIGRRPVRAPGAASTRPGFWHATSQFVMRHPVAVLLITLVPLVIVGLPFLRIQFAVFDARSLPASHEARAVDEVLRQQFPRNETQPIEVVVQSSEPVLEMAALEALHAYAQRLAAVPGVRRVDSLVSLDPRLDAGDYATMYSAAGLAENPLATQAVARFAGGPASHATVLSVLYDSDPYSQASQDLVRRIRDLPVPAGLRVRVGGEPAYLVDFLGSLANTVPLAFGAIIAAMFVLLFLMLGSLVVPLKAVLLTALSLTFSFGALVWVFQDGHLAGLLNFTPVGSIDGAMPVLVFAGLFGLSMDYEVFLLSRIKEDYDRTGDLPAAVAAGLQKTGAIITSAALLLVVVTASFTTGEVLYVKQVGVSLCLAILADATVVRTLLVPATMRLMNRYNWWAPAPLQAIYYRLHSGAAA